MADIASVFHWPLSELDAMGLEELTMWRRLALERRPRERTDGTS
ncbi:MAG: GpE family phage tail protein [Shimia sp.]